MGFISELFGYLLNALYELFNNYGIAIIVFSVILRIILIPITIKQQKSMKKSAELQEEMKEISKKYKNNPEKLNQETIELYKREKMSPFSGCLSSIVQILIILSVFWLVSQPLTYMKRLNDVPYDSNNKESNQSVVEYYKNRLQQESENQKSAYSEIAIINKYAAEDERVSLNMEFLGLDLSKVPGDNLSDWKVYVIPVLYVISSVISIKITTNMSKKKNEEAIKTDENSENNEMEAMEAMNKNMTYMMPIMSVFIAFIAPLGLALYWFVSNLLMIVEKIIIDKIMKHKEEKENA
mgnify:CR=1 FL=1